MLLWVPRFCGSKKNFLKMRIPRLNISFARYSDADFLNKANHIASSMTDNPAFPTPVPPLADVQDAIATYSTNLTAAAALGRVNVAEKNQSRFILELVLVQLARYVMYTANGDATILISSGFDVARDPQPRHLDNPGAVIVGNGNTSGTLTAAIKKGNATSFVHEITDTLPTDTTVWTKYPTNTRQFVFTNLTPGKQYWVRVAAVGYRNQVAYSTIATQFVQ
jgi:hypothetical protein